MTPAQQAVWTATYAAVITALAGNKPTFTELARDTDTWARIEKRAAWEAEAAVNAFNNANAHG